jgi:CBS domain-containing protein
MASNDKWRQPLREWERYFTRMDRAARRRSRCCTAPSSSTSTACTGRPVGRPPAPADRPQGQGQCPRFLACMARNALLRTPPLGFFKDFVIESDGRHTNAINLKRRGTAPLVRPDPRACAGDRLARRATPSAAQGHHRCRHPAAGSRPGPRRRAGVHLERCASGTRPTITGGRIEPDNSIEPDKLSDFDRKSLRDAFLILSNAQKYLKYRYQPGRSV